MNAFSLNHVSMSFGARKALTDVTLSVAPGERVALIGPSGSGKTTLLRALVASVRPQVGQVHVLGEPCLEMDEARLRRLRARVGFVHQDLALVPNLSVLRNVILGRLGQMSLGRSLWNVLFPSRAMYEECEALLRRVGVPGRLADRLDRLSGGQKQRVAIARALYQRPELLLADEPVASVDPARAASVVRLLSELAMEYHLTLAVSLHQPELARAHFDRVVGMRDGRVVFDKSPSDLGDDELASLYRLCDEPETGPSVMEEKAFA